MLYEWMSATQAFTVVIAYHVIRYDRIVSDHVNGRTEASKRELVELFRSYGLTDRVIDSIRVGPDLPEEYGFAIDPGPRPHLSFETAPRFEELCRKLRLVGGDRPVLLKNPWDVLHFAFVKQTFANARFIFVHREPLAVINSQLRAIRSMLAERNDYLMLLACWYKRLFDSPVRLRAARWIWNPRTGIGLHLARRHVKRVAEYFLGHIQSLPADDYLAVRYEDLCAEPEDTMQRIIGFAGVTPPAWPQYRDLSAPRGLKLLAEVEQQQTAIRRQLRSFYEYAGYAS